MIDINALTEADKGREVRYISHQVAELGRITSWNDAWIFVRYHTKTLTNVFTGEITTIPRTGDTSEATSPGNLEFCV